MKVLLKRCSSQINPEELANMCINVDRTYIANRLPDPYTIDDANWWINMGGEHDGKDGIYRVIMVDDKIVGNISVEKKSDVYAKDAEVGYLLSREYCSKGIVTEAVRQICEIAFLELDIIRITAQVFEPNIGSRKVLEKNDFVLEGIMKNALFKDDNVYNLCIYGKVKQRIR